MNYSIYKLIAYLILFFNSVYLSNSLAQTLQATAISRFNGDFAKIQRGKRIQQLFRTGKLLVDEVSSYGDSLSIAKKNGSYGAIISTGKIIVPFRYEEISEEYDFQDGSQRTYNYFYPVVKMKGRFGAFDLKGKVKVGLLIIAFGQLKV
ncbi:hypothetical protein SAMN05216436_106170 [bacterium A37T11]|nr:hypothetical protein SAMN05216436_106170 [bacterium A37T11]